MTRTRTHLHTFAASKYLRSSKSGRTDLLEEQASETPSSSRLCTELRAIKFLGSASARLLAANDYLVYFPASPLHREHLHGIDFDRLHQQARLAMSGNGTSGSFGTSPASGYFLNFMFMFIVFVTNTLDHALIFIYRNVMIYALIF